MPPRVFISYNHQDGATAERLKAAFEAAGIDVVIDEEDMEPGETIAGFLEDSIRETDATVSLISKNSLRSPWATLEIWRAFEAGRFASKRYIPCRLDREYRDPEFLSDATDEIDAKIEKIAVNAEGLRRKHQKTRSLDEQRARLADLRSNLDEIVATLQSRLTVDLAGDAFEPGVERLIASIAGAGDAHAPEATADAPAAASPPAADEATKSVWWRGHAPTLVVAAFFVAVFGWMAYKIPQRTRVERKVEALAFDVLERLGAGDVAGIEGHIALPFYLGADRLDEMEVVRARLRTIVRAAGQETERPTDSQQIRAGEALSSFIAGLTANPNYDLRGALELATQPDLEAEDEEDRRSLLLPAAELLENGARVTAVLRGLKSPAVSRVHFYFTALDDDAVTLRAMVFEKP